MKCSPFPFFFVGGGGISGRVRALNLTVPLGSGRVGSDNLGYGPGSGFSFEPVQTSSLSLMIRIKLTLTGKYIFILIYSLPNSYNHRNGINLITNIQEGEKRLLTHCSFARFLMNYFFFFDFMAGSTNIKVHYRHLPCWSVDQSLPIP